MFDMVGHDGYSGKRIYCNFDEINLLQKMFLNKKLITLNGPLSDIRNLDKVLWSYFCTYVQTLLKQKYIQ